MSPRQRPNGTHTPQRGLATLEHVVIAAVISIAVTALAGLVCIGVTEWLPPTPTASERCPP